MSIVYVFVTPNVADLSFMALVVIIFVLERLRVHIFITLGKKVLH